MLTGLRKPSRSARPRFLFTSIPHGIKRLSSPVVGLYRDYPAQMASQRVDAKEVADLNTVMGRNLQTWPGARDIEIQ